ncbi:helix-turn-helix domain-containing protein [Tsukamurella sp. PLM1]|uniref:helix-turn-helix domain-containing protein n=1 Tax=Tsukamurella sp. PLM1 TaxID=2929795 RepID=UPI00206FC7F1|nr:helix-turn-helix domain-containing protein [Tsukamurella sp. PLM1]BDH58788.1 hypothetical protein MTP03_37270 [Tsukamurella sp. PLM1]
MLTYLLDVGDLADARFVVSPLNETVLSLFHLNHVHASAPHLAGWRREADTRRDRYDRGLIDALVSRSGHQIPDFLTPAMTARTRPSFDAHLELVAATGADVARAELLELAEGEAPSAQLHTLIEHADPVGTVVEALDGYHRSAIAPLWPVIERILESDVTFRGRELANGVPGADDALRRLIGVAKADLLVALTEPAAVVDLAAALGVSPSAVSQSLKVLGANGIVESSRYGRRVLYRRTALGEALMRGEG